MLGWVVVDYDFERFRFGDIFRSHLDVKELESLHIDYVTDLLDSSNEQSTDLHRLLYRIYASDLSDSFTQTYNHFIKEVIRPLLGENLVFQRRPNIRFQMPGSVGVAEWHADRDVGHHWTETNIWIPLTEIAESNAVWVESRPGEGDFRPLIAQPGQALVFDGACLTHGNIPSKSSKTRLSIDFRVVRESLYRDRVVKSVNTATEFSVNGYFQRANDGYLS